MTAVSTLARDALHVERARLAVGPGLLGAIGFAAPLAVGAAVGRLTDAAVVSTGALIVGFVDGGGAYRHRLRTMGLTCAGVAVSGLVGGLTGGSNVLAVLLMGVWGLGAGLLVCAGRDASFVGTLAAWALLLTADLSVGGAGAAREAALLLAGGLLQLLPVAGAWALTRDAPERAAVQRALALLADEARATSAEARAASADALTAAAAACRDARRPGLGAVVEESESMRVAIAALPADSAAEQVRAVAADTIDAIASAVAHGSRAAERDHASDAVELLRRRAAGVPDPALRQRALALADHARDAVRAGATPAGGAAAPPVRDPRHGWRATVATLRANATPRSVACRHAIRLSVALMVAVVAYRVLPLQRGYWVPLTVLFVLKPDFATTFSRGIARALGTIAGVAAATAVASSLDPRGGVVIALLAVLVAVAYMFFAAAYALYTVALTIVIALLVELAGGSVLGALSDRLLDTALGAGLALGAYALWPTWEARRMPERLAELLDADRRWLARIMAAFVDPATYDPGALRADRLAARLARTNAEASIQHTLAEPHGADVAAGLPTAAELDRLALSGLTLVAALVQSPRTPHPEAAPLADALDDALARLGDGLRHDRAVAPPSVAPPSVAWPQLPDPGDDPAGAVLATEARRIAATIAVLTRRGTDTRPADATAAVS